MPMTACVVEDDSGIQALITEALQEHGFLVQAERDGAQALATLRRRLPDLLVTDILLPGLEGFELIKALRGLPGGVDVPVIAMSGIFRAQKYKNTALQSLGVRAYFEKPFEIAALIEAVRAALPLPTSRAKSPLPTGAAAASPAPIALPPAEPRQPPHGAQKSAALARARVLDDRLADRSARAESDEVERAAAGAAAGSRVVRGNLKHKRFPEVLAQLSRWRATGALLLRHDRTKKIVFLKDGYPIAVKSNVLTECLGRLLVRERMISEADCEKSLVTMKEQPGRQQGGILIEMGSLSPHNLVFALQRQLEEKLFDIFGWPDGDWQFNADIALPAQAVQLDMALATVVYEGVRRRFVEPQLDALLEPFLDAYVTPHHDPALRNQELALEADERRLLALIDGRRTLRTVLLKSGMTPLAAKQLAYTLLAIEALTVQRAPTGGVDLPRTATPRAQPPPLHKKVEPAASERFRDELRTALIERARSMRKQTHYELLGVAREAQPAELLRAYTALKKELRFDRPADADDARGGIPSDARAIATQIEQQLAEAYETLIDDGRRAAYDLERLGARRSGAHAEQDELGRILAAETRLRQGELYERKGLLDDAHRAYADAVALHPHDGVFHARLAFVTFSRAPHNVEAEADAIRQLEHAVELSPRADDPHLLLGRIHSLRGRTAEATAAYERALACNPASHEARAALATTPQGRASRRA